MEVFQFESAAEEARVDIDSWMDQFNQLDNLHTYSVDRINNLNHENVQLLQKQYLLNSEISRISYFLTKAKLALKTYSDENKTLSQEKRGFLNKVVSTSQQLSNLQRICDNQEQCLHSLKLELKEVTESSIAEKNSLLQSRITLSIRTNQPKEEYSKLKDSHTTLAKENTLLLSKEKNLKSRLKGIVGDKFDDSMNHWENTFLTLVQI